MRRRIGGAVLSDARCPACQGVLALSDEPPPPSAYRSARRYSSGRPRSGVVYGLCARCGLMIEGVALMLEADEEDRAGVLDAIDRARRARAIFDRGFGDKHAAMSTLAGAFHALREGVPGVEPWDPEALWAWVEEGTASGYELACARFVLTVWDQHGPAAFDAMGTLAGWDRAHRAAFVEWVREPWWP